MRCHSKAVQESKQREEALSELLYNIVCWQLACICMYSTFLTWHQLHVAFTNVVYQIYFYLCSYRWRNSNWRKVHSQRSKCRRTYFNWRVYIPRFFKPIVYSNVTLMEASLITVWQHSVSVEARKMASQATGIIWRMLYNFGHCIAVIPRLHPLWGKGS